MNFERNNFFKLNIFFYNIFFVNNFLPNWREEEVDDLLEPFVTGGEVGQRRVRTLDDALLVDCENALVRNQNLRNKPVTRSCKSYSNCRTVLLLTVRYAFSSFVLFPNPAMKGAEDSGNKFAIPERQSILNSSGFLVQTSRNKAEIKDDGFNRIGP